MKTKQRVGRPKLPTGAAKLKVVLAVTPAQREYLKTFLKTNQDLYQSQAHIMRTALNQFITNNPLTTNE